MRSNKRYPLLAKPRWTQPGSHASGHGGTHEEERRVLLLTCACRKWSRAQPAFLRGWRGTLLSPSIWSLLSLREVLSLLTSRTLPSRPALPSLALSVCLLSRESISPSLWLQTQWVMPWSEESRNQFLKGPSQSLPWLFLPSQGEVPLPKWNKLVQTISSAGSPLAGGREGAVGTALDTKQPATLWLLPPAPRWPPPPPPPPCLHAPSLFHSLSFP